MGPTVIMTMGGVEAEAEAEAEAKAKAKEEAKRAEEQKLKALETVQDDGEDEEEHVPTSVEVQESAPGGQQDLSSLNILELRSLLISCTEKVGNGDESAETMELYDRVGELYMEHPDSQLSDEEARAKLAQG